jgi:quercetin dioxygenase-like cupin family protein
LLLTPVDLESKVEPFLLEINPRKSFSGHFFTHKGEEMGYLLSGELQVKLAKGTYTLKEGDLMILRSESPLEWKNSGQEIARLLWIKIR